MSIRIPRILSFLRFAQKSGEKMDTMTNIVALLAERKIEQKDLCAAIGVKSSVFSDWKAGRNKSYAKHLPAIARFFGVTTDFLINGDKKEAAPATREERLKKIMELFGQLTEEEKAEFLLSLYGGRK